MILAAVKILHILAIAVWAGGLLALPFLCRQRVGIAPGPALDRLHRAVRFLYLALLSPAAIIAIASGVWLAFLRETFVPWFAAKLYLVAVMAILHVLAARLILRLFEPGGRYPLWRATFAASATGAAAMGVLVLVLAKPHIPLPMMEPGGLAPFIPWVSPPLPPPAP